MIVLVLLHEARSKALETRQRRLIYYTASLQGPGGVRNPQNSISGFLFWNSMLSRVANEHATFITDDTTSVHNNNHYSKP